MKTIRKPLSADEMKEMMEKEGRIEGIIETGEGFLKRDIDEQNEILSAMICGDDSYFMDINFEVLENSRGYVTLKVTGIVEPDEIV